MILWLKITERRVIYNILRNTQLLLFIVMPVTYRKRREDA